MYYYGVRYAKNCSPSDLFVTYWTSSKYVHEMIEKFGLPDIIQVRRIFQTQEQAIAWEEKVLRRMKVLQSDKWINKNISGAIYLKEFSEEHKRKISISNKGKHDPIHALNASKAARLVNTGKKRPEHSKIIKQRYAEGRYKNSVKKGEEHSWYGKTHSQSSIEKMSQTMKNKPKQACCLICKDKTKDGLWLSHFNNHHKECV